jgi:hypothetical protein
MLMLTIVTEDARTLALPLEAAQGAIEGLVLTNPDFRHT